MIPIFMTIDNYNSNLSMASVTICSILENTNENIHVIFLKNKDFELSNYECGNFSKIKEKYKNFSYSFYNLDNSLYKTFSNPSSTYVSYVTYYRYEIGNISETYDKCIYLDTDVIVNGDIGELFKIPLGNNLLAAVRNDKTITWNEKFLQKVVDSCGVTRYDYFNAGVLLINHKRWKELNVSNKLVNISSTRGNELVYADQDALNIVAYKQNLEIPDYFNFYGKRLTKEQKLPLIIHYVGKEKPWNQEMSWRFDPFWKYAKKSPWYSDLLKIQDQSLFLNIENYYILGLKIFSKINYREYSKIKIFSKLKFIEIIKTNYKYAIKMFGCITLFKINKSFNDQK